MGREHRGSRRSLWLATALGLLAGCNVIFGLEEVEPLPEDEGAGGSTTSASTGGAGGMATSSSSAGGASSSTGAGAGGSGGGGVCDASTIGTTIGCSSGEKCSATMPPNGPPGCVPAGPRPAWSVCTIDAQCEAGTWCDLVRHVCKPVCSNAACPGNGSCIDAPDGNSGTVANLDVCVADCEPVGATPCNQSQGDVACVRSPDGLDCMESGSAAENASCFADHVCAPGLVCFSASYCGEWCTIGGNDCPGGFFCVSLNPQVMSGDGNTEYGICGLSVAP